MTIAPGGVPRDITVRALRARELQVTWQVSLTPLDVRDYANTSKETTLLNVVFVFNVHIHTLWTLLD